MDTQDIVQQLKDEGSRSRGQTDLLTIYRARFGSVPRKIRAAIERTRDDAALTKWVEIPLPSIAREAGKREVFDRARPPCRDGAQVLHGELNVLPLLWRVAVLAAVTCTEPDGGLHL